jgi:hypothetical protein
MFEGYRKRKLLRDLRRLSVRMETVANKYWNFDPEDKPLRDTLNGLRNVAATLRSYLTIPRMRS